MNNKSINVFKNINKDIYIANKSNTRTYDSENNEMPSYLKPIYLGKLNYQPLSGNELQSYMSAYGETKAKIVRLFLDIKYKDVIKPFDLAYLYNITPIGESLYGDNANYIIKTVDEQNTVIKIILEEIIKEG